MPVQPDEDKGIQYNSGEVVDERPALSFEALVQYKTALMRTFEELRDLQPDPSGSFDLMMQAYDVCKKSIDQTCVSVHDGALDENSLENLNTAIVSLNACVSNCLQENNGRELSQEGIMRDSLFKKALLLPTKADDIAINYGKNDPTLGAKAEDIKYGYHMQTLENLKGIRERFKKQESIVVHSSDKYMNLQKSLKVYIALAEKSLGSINQSEAFTKLDKALENINKCAKDYVDFKIQKEARKRTDRGQERLRIVDDMKKQDKEALANSSNFQMKM